MDIGIPSGAWVEVITGMPIGAWVEVIVLLTLVLYLGICFWLAHLKEKRREPPVLVECRVNDSQGERVGIAMLEDFQRALKQIKKRPQDSILPLQTPNLAPCLPVFVFPRRAMPNLGRIRSRCLIFRALFYVPDLLPYWDKEQEREGRNSLMRRIQRSHKNF
ncbi:MAG: hypothetical protein PHQ47_01350 [Candidatus Portnoybacteria bacterium]|nr:hypothetical protein [Candidatus Portnoybacteria bacterium]